MTTLRVGSSSNAQPPPPPPPPIQALVPAPAPALVPISTELAPRFTITAPDGSLDPGLVGLGWQLAPTTIQPRIVVDISGHSKTGKTRMALSATEPIAYFAFDPLNVEGVVEEFRRAGKTIIVLPIILTPNQEMSYFQGLYQSFVASVNYLNQSWARGTIVVDTGAALEQLIRLNLYGKLKGVGTYDYSQRNQEMEAAYQVLMRGRLNILFLHNMKKVWIAGAEGRSTWNGQYEPDRNQLIEQRVQVNMVTWRESWNENGLEKFGAFHNYIQNCRLDSSLGGLDAVIAQGEMNAFTILMAQIFKRPVEDFL